MHGYQGDKPEVRCTLASGPAGGALSGLDQLNGIPCNGGAGNTQISYGGGGSVTITCATPRAGREGRR